MANITKREAEAYLKELEALVSRPGDLGLTLPLQHDPELHEGEAALADDGELRFCPGCRAVTLLHRLGSIIFDHTGIIEVEIERRSPGLVRRAGEAARLEHENQALKQQVESLPAFKAQVEQQSEHIVQLEQQVAALELERVSEAEAGAEAE